MATSSAPSKHARTRVLRTRARRLIPVLGVLVGLSLVPLGSATSVASAPGAESRVAHAKPLHGDSTPGWRINARRVGLAPHGLSCSNLPTYRGPARPARGAVISKRLITRPLDLSRGDILVTKSCIRPTSTGYHNNFLVTTTTCRSSCWATKVGRVRIKDSEISGTALSADRIAGSCGFLGVARLTRNYIHGMGSGICFFETGTKHNALALNNYVTGLRSYGDSHNEAATVRDFRRNATNTRRAEFIGNRLDCSSGNVTGGLFIQPTWEDIYNVQVRRNYIEGEGYNLFVSGTSVSGVRSKYGSMRSINNRFRSTGWGPSAVTQPPGWSVWRDNYRYAAGKHGARGSRVRP